ncbi:MAG: HAD hydrolase-like protein [Bacteroidetes bacterium]|nr:HAD hydrolase-like protein [Bacteroidota bacterium]
MSIALFNIDFFKNLKLFLKPRNLIAKDRAETISEVMGIIKNQNFKGVIFDVDQTIVPYGETIVDLDIKNEILEITKTTKCCMLSNFPKTKEKFERLSEIQRQLGIPLTYSDEKKPSPKAFMAALNILETKASDTAMVGDRIFTDIMGANNVEIYTIYQRPLNPKTDPFFWVTIPRIIENFIVNVFKIFLKK